MNARCVVFDVDDTLYLERDYVRSGFEAAGRWAAEAWGLPDFAPRAWRLFEAGVRGNTFNAVLEAAGLEPAPERVKELVKRYREHEPRIALCPDAEACLMALHGRAALAVVTDGPAASQRAKVEALGLARWCDPLVLTAELGEGFGKPHPRAFERVAEAAGCAGQACVYVADNVTKDFQGPKALGWRTVRVRRPGALHAELPSGPEVDVELPDLAGLPAWLEAQG
ncbi:MAG: HAD family hydrolase [Planctomycetota bacterium]|nr:HAD family hydrolase [Planctomycetota bacterium]